MYLTLCVVCILHCVLYVFDSAELPFAITLCLITLAKVVFSNVIIHHVMYFLSS